MHSDHLISHPNGENAWLHCVIALFRMAGLFVLFYKAGSIMRIPVERENIGPSRWSVNMERQLEHMTTCFFDLSCI